VPPLGNYRLAAPIPVKKPVEPPASGRPRGRWRAVLAPLQPCACRPASVPIEAAALGLSHPPPAVCGLSAVFPASSAYSFCPRPAIKTGLSYARGVSPPAPPFFWNGFGGGALARKKRGGFPPRPCCCAKIQDSETARRPNPPAGLEQARATSPTGARSPRPA